MRTLWRMWMIIADDEYSCVYLFSARKYLVLLWAFFVGEYEMIKQLI